MPVPAELPVSIEHFPSFIQFGSSHILAVAIAGIVGSWLIYYARKQSPNVQKNIARWIGWLCLAAIPGGIFAATATTPSTPWQDLLPLHFCDIMLVCCAWALLVPLHPISTCAYFCSLAATTQALITPSVVYDYPSPAYFSFFFSHAIVILSALYIPLVFGWIPKPSGKYMAQLFGICYLIVIYPVNVLLNTNFGFALRPPDSDSVLSLLGPWPWYLVAMQIPGFIVLFLIDLPFRPIRLRQKHCN